MPQQRGLQRQRVDRRLSSGSPSGRTLTTTTGGKRAGEQGNAEPGLNSGRLLDWSAEVERRERLWTQVFDEPSEWSDYRAVKDAGHVRPSHPDFERRSTGEAVWVNSFFGPPWAAAKLEAAAEAGSRAWVQVTKSDLLAEVWRRLFENSKRWLDFRGSKAGGQLKSTHPDFVEDSRDGEVLWVGDPDTPDWVPARLREADQDESFIWRRPGDAPWIELFDAPASWRDFRVAKAAGEFVAAMPDFMHRSSGAALWVDQVPRWAAARLRAMDRDGESPWPEERRAT